MPTMLGEKWLSRKNRSKFVYFFVRKNYLIIDGKKSCITGIYSL